MSTNIESLLGKLCRCTDGQDRRLIHVDPDTITWTILIGRQWVRIQGPRDECEQCFVDAHVIPNTREEKEATK